MLQLRYTAGQQGKLRERALQDHRLFVTKPVLLAHDALMLGAAHDDLLALAVADTPIAVLREVFDPDARLDESGATRVVRVLETLVSPDSAGGQALFRAWLNPGDRRSALRAAQGPMIAWTRALLQAPPTPRDAVLTEEVLESFLRIASLTVEDLRALRDHATEGTGRWTLNQLPLLASYVLHRSHPASLGADVVALIRSALEAQRNLFHVVPVLRRYPEVLEGFQPSAVAVLGVLREHAEAGLQLFGMMAPTAGAALWREVFGARPEYAVEIAASLPPAILAAIRLHRDDVKRLLRHPNQNVRLGGMAFVGVRVEVESEPMVAPAVEPGEPEPADAACHDPQMAAWFRSLDPAVAAYRHEAQQQRVSAARKAEDARRRKREKEEEERRRKKRKRQREAESSWW